MAEYRSFKADHLPLKPEVAVLGREVGGFNFDNAQRNSMLSSKGMTPPKALKTGTTICGVVYRNGVVLGADTRATEGETVADKNCEKIHYMAPNIYCCGAGTAADTEQVTAMTSSQLELLRLQTKRQTRVVNAMTQLKRHLFKYQGHVGAYLVLGGVDINGPHLHTIWAAGSTDTLPYVTMGSGSLAAMAMMESEYKDGLTEAEAVALVKRAIQAGIFNDLGSGSNVDICVIRQVGDTATGEVAAASAASSSSSAAAAAAHSTTSTAAEDCGLDESDIAEAVAFPAVLASSGAEMPFDTPVNVGRGIQVVYKRGYESATNDAAAFRARVVPVAAKTIPRGATEVVAKMFRECVVVETVATDEDGDEDM